MSWGRSNALESEDEDRLARRPSDSHTPEGGSAGVELPGSAEPDYLSA